MSFEFFDSHSHLNLEDFDLDKNEVIEKMREYRVGTLTVGTSFQTSTEAVRLSKENENLYACIGLHPNEVENEKFEKEKYAELLGQKTVCVGECGLDYFRSSNKDEQKTEFKKQIEFALENDLPLMLHIRPSKDTLNAYRDTLEILEEYKKSHGEKLRGQAHFFAGDESIAERFLSLGFYISFTGVITFTRDYDDVIFSVPLDRILTETDAPFVAPVPFRGKRCEPWHVVEVYKKLAELKGITVDELKSIIKNNLKTLYKIG